MLVFLVVLNFSSSVSSSYSDVDDRRSGIASASRLLTSAADVATSDLSSLKKNQTSLYPLPIQIVNMDWPGHFFPHFSFFFSASVDSVSCRHLLIYFQMKLLVKRLLKSASFSQPNLEKEHGFALSTSFSASFLLLLLYMFIQVISLPLLWMLWEDLLL